MNELKEKLITQAQRQYRYIWPCAAKDSLDECFTVSRGKLIFWFNTRDNSTHIMSEPLFSMAEK
jgi:hypothetical protein